MRLQDEINNFTGLCESDCVALIGLLTPRENEAILKESRLEPRFWHLIFEQLMPLASAVTPTADEVRLAISAALEDAILVGPPPTPVAGTCERVVSYSGAVSHYSREISLSREVVEDHIESWESPAISDPLNACKRLLGHLTSGRRPSWAVPFSTGHPRPLDGCSASHCHQRLALHPEADGSEKLVFAYEIPPGTSQSIPTIGDAYRWNDDTPHWRSFFLPAPPGVSPGFTAPVVSGLDGVPEIVHDPVALEHLICPPAKRI